MSAINKKPFLVSLIESLSEEQISTLRAMINGEGNQTVLMRTMHVKPLGERTHLTAADKGIHRCNLEVDFSLLNGYLIYTDDYCVLICYTDFQTLSWYNLDLVKMNANTISEELTILELRSELDDSSAAEKAEIINTVNEAIEDGDIDVVTEIEANPTMSGNEPVLEGLDIEGEKYKVPQPIDVEANPTMAGTEANLAGLKVGNTKYKVVTPNDVETAVNNAVYGAIDASY